MTNEEMFATVIREAFRCGKEAGEAYQRLYYEMEQRDKELSSKVSALQEENQALGDTIQERDATITELLDEIKSLIASQ